jgi:hypothetical protein
MKQHLFENQFIIENATCKNPRRSKYDNVLIGGNSYFIPLMFKKLYSFYASIEQLAYF